MKLLFNLTHNSRSNPIEYFFGYLKDKLKNLPYKDFKTLAGNIFKVMKRIEPSTFQGFYRQAMRNSLYMLNELEMEYHQ